MPTFSPDSLAARSEEVQELITRVPRWLIRWGTTVVLMLLLGLLLVSWWIRYPDVVQASFRLTSVNAPKSILARTDGKLVRLLVRDGESVRAGQALAYLESTADHAEVLRLEGALNQAWQSVRRGDLEALNQRQLTDYHQLGELQSSFQTFEQSLIELRAYLAGNFYSQKKALLQQELADLQALAENLRRQQQLQAQDRQLAQDEYEVQRKLAEEKVIAPLDLKREESRRLARTLPYQQTAAALIQNLVAQRTKRQEMLVLDKQVTEYRHTFLQRLNTLRSALDAWKARYVAVTPVAGTVFFPTFLQENQFVNTRQELFYIAPRTTEYFGEVRVPQRNFGKVKIGQRVLIKFDGYPFEQYGFVRGQIATLADIPVKDSVFLAKVALPHGLTTTYNRKLAYKTGLSASAEIVTDEARLLQRLLYALRQATSTR